MTIGVIGHTDHGKTSLVRCLTGIDTDSAGVEKRRGMSSMQCGISPLQTGCDCPAALIDVPGNKQFLKNTIRGLCAVDMVILVVAADDGIMPQTTAHLELVRHFNIEHGFIVLSKTDLVDEELLELAELEIREATENTLLNAMPVIRFSAVDHQGLSDVQTCIGDMVRHISHCSNSKKPNRPFRLWIDKVRRIPGAGTVACGTILSGTVSINTPLVLLPDGKETRARTLEAHHQQVTTAYAGQRVGINLPKISINDVQCGMTLAQPDAFTRARFINVCMHADQMIKDRMRVKFQLGTFSDNATVVLMQHNVLKPGETGLAQLRFKKPIAAMPDDRFIIIMMNSPVIIGGGTVLEVSRQKYRAARSTHIIPFLDAMKTGDMTRMLKAYLQKKDLRPVSAEEIASATMLTEKDITRELHTLVEQGEVLKIAQTGYYLKSCHDPMTDRIIEIIQQVVSKEPLNLFVNKEEIKTRLCASIDDRLFNHLMNTLVRDGRIQKHTHLYTLPGLSGTLTPEQNELADQLLIHADSIGISPFTAGGFCKQSGKEPDKNHVLKVLNHLCHEGRLIRLSRETFIHPMAVQTIKQYVKKAADAKPGIHLSDCKEIFGYGRTKGEVVFQYLDHIGFTLRQGDYRVLR